MLKLIKLIVILAKIKIQKLIPIFQSKEKREAMKNLKEFNKQYKNSNRHQRRAMISWLKRNQ